MGGEIGAPKSLKHAATAAATGTSRRTREITTISPEFALPLLLALALLAAPRRANGRRVFYDGWEGEEHLRYRAPSCRSHVASLEDFGGVGDGATSNTMPFRSAVDYLSRFHSDGGGLLYLPAGRWLTGSFNLTSSFTLFLHRDAVLLGSPDPHDWPLVDPLPSYGRGRDAPGRRHGSLLQGYNLTDVVITGDNGTIDGQGQTWWSKYLSKQLRFTRGYLVELLHSTGVTISNLTFINSPSWNIHPVYSTRVRVTGVTILAPHHSPNTDGINPDSCSDVLIEDCHIVSGDDCVAIKSGWDQYGIRFGMPSRRITVRRLSCVSPSSAVIALGSEMSGGVELVRAEDITAVHSQSGVRIKTAIGRGGYVRDIFVRGVSLRDVRWVFWMGGSYGQHPDDGYDRAAMPVVRGVSFSDVVATETGMVGRLEGIEGAPFSGICVSNVTAKIVLEEKKKRRKLRSAWLCTDIEGVAADVRPKQCPQLRELGSGAPPCSFPEFSNAAELELPLQDCLANI